MTRPRATGWMPAVALLLHGVAVSAGDGLVSLQSADPACPDDSGNRYVDCENGTVTDNETGLVWLAKADCFGPLNWHEAMESVAGLADVAEGHRVCWGLTEFDCDCGLDDNSSPGEWRLPTYSELFEMIEQALGLPCQYPTLTDDSGNNCWEPLWCFSVDPPRCSFSGVQSARYWTASTVAFLATHAWTWTLGGGSDAGYEKMDNSPPDLPYYAWPVRGGQ